MSLDTRPRLAYPGALLLAAALLFAPVQGVAQDSADAEDTPKAEETTKKKEKKKETKKNSKADCDLDDCRTNAQAHIFIGSAIDSFAARELNNYLNPEASGDTSDFERLVGGVLFGYRLKGDPTKAKESQLWVYGWTRHGVRSTDIDCKANEKLPTCQTALAPVANQGDAFLFILRNATSLEGAGGFRWEFRQLQSGGDSSARLYLHGEYGFLAVSGDDDDLLDMSKIGLGFIVTKGRYQGSHLEVGFGQSRVFETDSNGRLKIDGLIKWEFGANISGIAQINIDSDAGSGADSIQSYLGFAYSFPKQKTK